MMGENIKVNLKMINLMGMDNIQKQMGKYIKDNGKMVNSMEMANLLIY